MATKRKLLNRPFAVKSVEADGSFTGYASVFGQMDDYNDIVMPGAFTKSLNKKAANDQLVPILWQHDPHNPIGVYPSIKEDGHGLLVSGQLVQGVQQADEAYLLMKARALTGISIGYMPVKDTYDSKSKTTSIIEVDLWEASLVTFPALDSARVDSVKSLTEVMSLADCEAYLREVGGFSHKDAKAIISRIKTANSQRDADEGGSTEIKEALSILRSIKL